MSARPCVHPGCRDKFGDRRLVADGMCRGCRNQLRRTLGLIAADYERLALLPRPQGPDTLGRKATPEGFGHPAERASELCAEIAESLVRAHQLLACVLGGLGPSENLSQAAHVAQSRQWLDERLETICELDHAGKLASEWGELRERTKPYGVAAPMVWLGGKCPGCENLTVWRCWDEVEEHYDRIVCSVCDWEPDEGEIADWLDQYQAQWEEIARHKAS
ncbi:conserved hypothetical protein [Segniliparus rotundus DSM 44985]|uniref:Uncharacterized protein n=1 Tax=Segniliparus rotundus (strain ATCC BAA-972 / CDC 1076 / CIP 108378 / DSM 44985 / JCM 13578) TaxID=640132 RepID=D6ZFC2_SEGRD|nr:hypothetical protein [Segniliparus rotundus]ADG97646.1 conserved hypothetical protein [Segniliparus rotundus DSM 44985]